MTKTLCRIGAVSVGCKVSDLTALTEWDRADKECYSLQGIRLFGDSVSITSAVYSGLSLRQKQAIYDDNKQLLAKAVCCEIVGRLAQETPSWYDTDDYTPQRVYNLVLSELTAKEHKSAVKFAVGDTQNPDGLWCIAVIDDRADLKTRLYSVYHGESVELGCYSETDLKGVSEGCRAELARLQSDIETYCRVFTELCHNHYKERFLSEWVEDFVPTKTAEEQADWVKRHLFGYRPTDDQVKERIRWLENERKQNLALMSKIQANKDGGKTPKKTKRG